MRVQHAVAAHFCEIAHHSAELLAARSDLLVAVLHGHEGFIAFYVGGDCARAHMALIAQHGIAHIIVMRNLHTVKQHHIFQLCGIANDRILPDNSTLADKGAVTNLSTVVNNTG